MIVISGCCSSSISIVVFAVEVAPVSSSIVRSIKLLAGISVPVYWYILSCFFPMMRA